MYYFSKVIYISSDKKDKKTGDFIKNEKNKIFSKVI